MQTFGADEGSMGTKGKIEGFSLRGDILILNTHTHKHQNIQISMINAFSGTHQAEIQAIADCVFTETTIANIMKVSQ